MIAGLSSAGNEIKHQMLQKGGIGYNNTIYEKGLCVRIVKMEWMPSPSGSIVLSYK